MFQIIELDISDPKIFATFVGNFKVIQKHAINFYVHEVKNSNGAQDSDPPLHIIAKVDGKIFKKNLVYGGSTINIISTTAYKSLNLPIFHIYASSLQLKAFNDALCLIVGSISLPIIVEMKTI